LPIRPVCGIIFRYTWLAFAGKDVIFLTSQVLTSVPMRLGLMYKLSGADTGNHSLSIDTRRSMPLSNTSVSIDGRPTLLADLFNLCKFSSGLNRFMWPCSDLYAFIPSNTYATKQHNIKTGILLFCRVLIIIIPVLILNVSRMSRWCGNWLS
jgi:hypothetical protein